LVKEAVARAIAVVVAKLRENPQIDLPTLNRLKELALDRRTPVEVRAGALIALARLSKLGVRGLDLLPNIVRILDTEENVDLLVAAVEALAILDDDNGVPALLKAYDSFFDKNNLARENDVRIRTAIIKAVGSLMDAQTGKKTVNAGNLRLMVELLLKIVDPAAEHKENNKIIENAIFDLRYLYPKRPEFQVYHQKVAEKLILILRKGQEAGELKAAALDTLTIITRRPFGDNLERWENWHDTTYPGFKLPKGTP
jgi:hypothetical protein